MKTLRAELAELMVQRHLISRELADYHVREMTDVRVAEEWLLYMNFGAELSAAGPNPRTGNAVSCPGSTTRDDDGRPAALNRTPNSAERQDRRESHARFGSKKTWARPGATPKRGFPREGP